MATGLLSLAALFSTAIDCFTYYSAARDCPRRLRTLLVKLDFEKTRLLIWANTVGLVNTNEQLREVGLGQHEEIIRRTLEQIVELLAEAGEMQERYGVRRREDDEGLEKIVEEQDELKTDMVSQNSMVIFRTAYARFRGKYPGTIQAEKKQKLSARLRWSVVDKGKFEGLIITLREFVDNLFLMVPVDRQTQDSIVEDDILAVTDLEELEIIQEATEDSYRVWSEVASKAIERSERDTMAQTHIRRTNTDRDGFDAPAPPRVLPIHGNTRTDNTRIPTLPKWKASNPPMCFLLTHKCTDFSTPPSCKDEDFGAIMFKQQVETQSYHKWQLTKNKFDVGARLNDQFSIGNWSRGDVQDFWKKDASSRTPAGKSYYYVGPCQRQIQEAYACLLEGSSVFSATIRVDERLRCSCCQGAEVDLVKRLSSLRDWIERALEMPKRGSDIPGRLGLTGYFDRLYLEQRIYEVDVSDPSESMTDDPFRRFGEIFDEASYVEW